MDERTMTEVVSKLGQDDLLNRLTNSDPEQWIQIEFKEFSRIEDGIEVEYLQWFWVFLALKENTDKVLENSAWNLRREDGKPGFVYIDGEYEYRISGDLDEGVIPFLYYRNPKNGEKPTIDINQEFILLFDLCYSETDKTYYSYSSGGEAAPVVKVLEKNEQATDRVAIRVDYLAKFAAAKKSNIVVEIDSIKIMPAFSSQKINKEELKRKLSKDMKSTNYSYSRWGGTCDSQKVFSRIQGKYIIQSMPLEDIGIWPYENQEEKVRFLIGLDQSGRYIYRSPEQDSELNFDLVTFNVALLEKYRENKRYRISESSIAFANKWEIPIRFSSLTQIQVSLDDISKYLPHSEWIYWKSKETLEDSNDTSISQFSQSLINPISKYYPIDIFKEIYQQTNDSWESYFGWNLFRPLSEGDIHIFEQMTIPLSDGQGDFDRSVLELAKLVNDSLNVKKITRYLKEKDIDMTQIKGSVNLLSKVMEVEFSDKISVSMRKLIEESNKLLKCLQSLRSSGSAHSKGKDYEKAIRHYGDSEMRNQGLYLTILKEVTIALEQIGIVVSLASLDEKEFEETAEKLNLNEP